MSYQVNSGLINTNTQSTPTDVSQVGNVHNPELNELSIGVLEASKSDSARLFALLGAGPEIPGASESRLGGRNYTELMVEVQKALAQMSFDTKIVNREQSIVYGRAKAATIDDGADKVRAGATASFAGSMAGALLNIGFNLGALHYAHKSAAKTTKLNKVSMESSPLSKSDRLSSGKMSDSKTDSDLGVKSDVDDSSNVAASNGVTGSNHTVNNQALDSNLGGANSASGHASVRIENSGNAGPRDAGPRDAGPRDASPRDASPRDASPSDASSDVVSNVRDNEARVAENARDGNGDPSPSSGSSTSPARQVVEDTVDSSAPDGTYVSPMMQVYNQFGNAGSTVLTGIGAIIDKHYQAEKANLDSDGQLFDTYSGENSQFYSDANQNVQRALGFIGSFVGQIYNTNSAIIASMAR